MIHIDTGDTVFHRPTRETWLVACVRDDRLSWLGWPEGYARLGDCLLVEKAAPGERSKLLHDLAEGSGNDHRRLHARRVLAEEAAQAA